MLNFFKKIKAAFSKTSALLGTKIRTLFSKPWDEKTLQELEKTLYEADLGPRVATEFTDHLKQFLQKQPKSSTEEILQEMERKALTFLTLETSPRPAASPQVFLILGVNGSGKTTSIAKLAKQFKAEGKTVLIAAGDTFRAAAIDQLTVWAQRLEIEMVSSQPGSDPAAVVFDALHAAKARNVDIVLIDTAGRLQNKTALMHELEKIKRICHKVIPGAPHETLLVLDSTVGQNGLDQAAVFNQFTPLTGIILTKVDGSAKGGVILAIYKELRIPVRWLGVGESADDLIPFEAESYVRTLFQD